MTCNLSATELAEYNTHCDEDFAKDYITELNHVTVFCDEIKKNLTALNFLGNPNNTDDIIDFVCERCEQVLPDIFNDPNDKSHTQKFNRKTLSNWIKQEDVPVSTVITREIMYKLCFALNMDEIATQNFFYKGFLERPFNYKSVRESIYYFCLKYRKSYTEAMTILKKVESTPMIENPDADNITSVIASRIRNIQTEEELITYLIENRSGFIHHNNSAYQLIEEELLPSCMDLATQESERMTAQTTNKQNKTAQINTIDKLLSVIYGYHARATLNYNKVFSNSISNKTASKFPRLIKENFPQRQQFSHILGHTASTGVIRKALIILKFYEFFTKSYLSNPISSIPNPDICEEFVDEMNTTLELCGYVQLYWRNPFDWMIGHCAQEASEGGNPVDCLRNLIETFYLSHQE